MTQLQSEKPADTFIYIGFLVLIAWIPLPFGSNRPWAWSVMEIGVYLLTILWSIQYLRGKVSLTRPFIKAKPLIVIYIIWLLFITFQIIPLPASIVSTISPMAFEHATRVNSAESLMRLSVNPYATLVGLYKSIAYFLFFCLTLLLINRRRRLTTLATVIVFSGLFQAVYGSLMVMSGLEYGGLFIEKHVNVGRTIGTFVNPNHLAGYLVMSLAIGIGLMISTLGGNEAESFRQKLKHFISIFLSKKIILRLALVMMVIGLVMTHSRMGNTAFFSSLLIAGVIGLIFSKHAPRSTIILLASLIIIDIFIVGAWFGVDKVVQRLEQTSVKKEMRDDVFSYAQVQIKDYKVIGSGLGSFYSVFPNYRGRDVSGYNDHAHNDYLQFSSETGLIGLSLLGIIVLVCLLKALQAQRLRRDPLLRGLSFSAIMAMIALLIHSTVDFNLQIPANAATINIIMALAWITRHHPTSSAAKI
jgi:O-antigen ligase